jgi:glycyl-tRNA synthetase beta chain
LVAKAKAEPELVEEKVEVDTSQLPECAPLLIEVGVEEMPAQVFGSLLKQLPELFKKFFEPTRLEAEDVEFFVTPRRIVTSIGSIKTRQADEVLELRGPPVRVAKDDDGNWTKAAEGFARKNGITLDQAEIRELNGMEYLFVSKEEKGACATEILGDVISQFLDAIHWYKTMRWGRNKAQFVRPVQWLSVMLGDVVVPASYAGIQSQGSVYGHRFLSNRLIEISSDREEYLGIMADNKVIVDHDQRRELIRNQIVAECETADLQWLEDDELLDEVTNLVEFPVPVLKEFNDKYLRIPDKVLVTEMKEHQRYFAVCKEDGSLSNHFIAISNMACDDMDLVGDGFEKVLRSRFDDAEFFLEDDVKITLEQRVPTLDRITYQTKLGSIGDKVRRNGQLAAWIADQIGLSDEEKVQVQEVARLCKADLTTKMVGEFPELQGEIGRYYAQQEDLDPDVAQGIFEHYLPKSVNSEFPGSVVAAVVAIADRIDSLVGISGTGKLPTGSADPFGLRRACLTSVALIVEKDFRIDFRALLTESARIIGDALAEKGVDTFVENLLEFTLARARGLFRDTSCNAIPCGFAYDSIDAVAQAGMSWYDVADFVDRLKAMEEFRCRDDFNDVAATFKRCNNILKETVDGEVDATLFEMDAERDLLAGLEKAEAALADYLPKREYVAAMAEIGPLREVVDKFFDDVMVNADDEAVRRNRQLLVHRVVQQVLQIADFSAIQ